MLLGNGISADFDASLLQAEQVVERMEQNLLKSSDITMKKRQRKLQKDINDTKLTLLT